MVDAQKYSLQASRVTPITLSLFHSEKFGMSYTWIRCFFLQKKVLYPKRDLQILREISDVAPSSKKYLEQLIEIAKGSARDRVVLKKTEE